MTPEDERRVPSEVTKAMPLRTIRAVIFYRYMERPDNVINMEGQSNSNEMKRYKLSVLGISETYWTQVLREAAIDHSEMSRKGLDNSDGRSKRQSRNGQQRLGKYHRTTRTRKKESKWREICKSMRNQLNAIGCTISPHKRLHKAAWVSSEHTQKNQVDHICINEEFGATVEGMRTRRGAHIASHHHMVVSKMELKLKKRWATDGKSLRRFNTASLQDSNKLNEFKTTLDNRFQALQDLLKEETTMVDNWKEIEEALTSTCQRVLGCKEHHHKERISIKILDKIQKRKNEKTAINNSRTGAVKIKVQADYTEANNHEKQIIRASHYTSTSLTMRKHLTA
ncbi:unnamed protein product [Schistosoma margrebowiei]|uniref:Uncharacterized protein n=1 Tax=Schistosoma margrebowiei TaxID=48269 RepID=A0A183M9G7_9TREM|nr:unnamed protein product [Schistosoma margrebowiei]